MSRVTPSSIDTAWLFEQMPPGERAAYANGFEAGKEALRAEIERLRAALKPFAEVASAFAGVWSSKYDDCPLAIEHCDADDRDITIADLKRLHAAIEQTPPREET